MPFLLIVISIYSISPWSKVAFDNTFIKWIANFIFLTLILYSTLKIEVNAISERKNLYLYLIIVILNAIRGLFVPNNYWEWKQYIDGTIILCLPFLIIPFSNPYILNILLRNWMKFGVIIFVAIILWIVPGRAFQFFLGPLLAFSIFLPAIRKEWQIILIAMIGLMLFVDFGARSQVIKSLLALLLSSILYFAKYLNLKIFKSIYWLLITLPIVLLFLGISGVFNPFEDLSKNQGKFIEQKVENGKKVEEDLSSDTRTFIYKEVISSALVNNYLFMGRTTARGNDSVYFGAINAEDLKTGKYERHKNELNFLNIFTWIGLIGLIPYSFFYIQAAFLAIYRSKNIFLKIIGVFIAFHFLYGWIEDTSVFDIINISIWMMIGMAYSNKFRNFTNRQFRTWLDSIFPKMNIF